MITEKITYTIENGIVTGTFARSSNALRKFPVSNLLNTSFTLVTPYDTVRTINFATADDLKAVVDGSIIIFSKGD